MVELQTAVFLPPAIERLHRDLCFLARLWRGFSVGDADFNLTQHRHDLLWLVPLDWHDLLSSKWILSPSTWYKFPRQVSITSVSGETPQFNALQPLGSLQYNYQQPLANVSIDIAHHVAWKAAWNYYQYGEQSFVGPTNPRNFHANNATFSLIWAF